MHATDSSASGQIKSVQCLRAIAALFVVGFHATLLLHDNFMPESKVWDCGNAGVDLFFVISGFIMVVSSRRLVGRPDGWRRFITARLVRIVPLYWLVTAAKLVLTTATPELTRNTFPTPWNTVASFLFLPAYDGAGLVQPVLHVGWTLSYEMLFYMLFGLALFLVRDPLAVVVPTLLALAATSILVQPDWPAITAFASPFLLEFLVGALIGRAFLSQRLQAIPATWAFPAIIVGLAGLAVLPLGGTWARVALWGSAAAVAVAGSVVCEPWLGRLLPKLTIKVGEASYSMYLTHGFVLPVIGVALAKSGMSGWPLAIVLVASCLVLSIISSLLIYEWIEAPMTNSLRRMVQEGPLKSDATERPQHGG